MTHKITQTSTSKFLSASACNQRLFAKEKKLLGNMGLLHKVFAHSTEEDLDLNKLTLGSFGVSKDLYDTAKNIHKLGIHIIPANSNERETIANVAITLG